MTIQIQFNSVQFDYAELKEHCPELARMLQSSLPKGKKTRRRKKKKTVACLIDEIQEKLNSG